MEVPVLTITRDGVPLAAAVEPAGVLSIFDNDGNVVVEVANPTGGSLVVSFDAQATFAGVSLSGMSVTVAAGATVWVGPFPPVVFNDLSGDVTGTAAAGLRLRGLRF